jgi:hypothetical protein
LLNVLPQPGHVIGNCVLLRKSFAMRRSLPQAGPIARAASRT